MEIFLTIPKEVVLQERTAVVVDKLTVERIAIIPEEGEMRVFFRGPLHQHVFAGADYFGFAELQALLTALPAQVEAKL